MCLEVVLGQSRSRTWIVLDIAVTRLGASRSMTPPGAGDRAAIIVRVAAIEGFGREIARSIKGLGSFKNFPVGLDGRLFLLVGSLGFFEDTGQVFSLQKRR